MNLIDNCHLLSSGVKVLAAAAEKSSLLLDLDISSQFDTEFKGNEIATIMAAVLLRNRTLLRLNLGIFIVRYRGKHRKELNLRRWHEGDRRRTQAEQRATALVLTLIPSKYSSRRQHN